jgi:hypothetical protein
MASADRESTLANDGVAQDILHKTERIADESETVSIGALVDAFGSRGFGPLLALGGLLTIVLTPLPATSSIFGVLLALLGAQFFLRGDEAPWLPQSLRRLEIGADRAHAAMRRFHPFAARIDVLFTKRAAILTSEGVTRLWGLLIVAMALAMIPLSVLPFGPVPLAFLLALMGLAITARDGVVLSVAGVLGLLVMTSASGRIL